MDNLINLYVNRYGVEPASVVRIPGAGSDRVYYRISAPSAAKNCIPLHVIGTVGDNLAENASFTGLAEVFLNSGIAVPEIYALSDDGKCYLQQDLGSQQLFPLLHTQSGEELLPQCMRSLARMQCVERSKWESHVFNPPFGKRMVMWDLNYFKYSYLKPSGFAFDEDALEDDFESLCRHLCSVPVEAQGFMMRDCQSRNVMILNGTPYWIDFQGGRFGPAIYDAVSMLWQAKAGLPDDVRNAMLSVHATEFGCIRGIDPESVLMPLPYFILFRTLQVLGAYGLRGLVEKKAHFIESIPCALQNLKVLLNREDFDADEFPELSRICKILISDERFKPHDGTQLNVYVTSFSFKKGYPSDFSGNGGGFVFDCRAMHNPGRYDQYKHLTGSDAEVISFLEERGEVQHFLKSCWSLADAAVARYLQRGFTSLQINFGCTGGQHRSVYCAEATASHISATFPNANVILTHREQ